ncbi:vWA domain-containing protein [Candidatus Nitronereus thalassa]|uniref:VWA domain-containing protein n=1 Tax=Candidatus Nitronereus thalassa TaxID=3020898 RepID=A0ABU3K918_9BACT|nr:VWA domain-containing protein [Candidatus Nitronereus thalassa]MDT7042944.1 VWA domain-containing protein [Candidatus Nitronereus thalassa]
MKVDAFHFLRPWWLFGLIPVAWVLWRLMRSIQAGRSWQQVCDPHLLPHLLIGNDQTGGKSAWVLLGLGWSLALLALAGPVWSKLPQPVVRSESALVIVLDISRSMDAQDLRPSRLTRAKHKVLDILKRRTEGQTGLVVFAYDPFVVSPLTDDAKTIASMVPTLSTDLAPVQGSRPELALERADELLVQSTVSEGTILLITDGAESSSVKNTAEALRDKGRVVSVLGVGSEEGAPIPLPSGGFLTDQSGAIVIPKLDPGILQELARLGGGLFETLQPDDRDLDRILDASLKAPTIDEAEDTERNTDQWQEEGPWLVLAVLMIGVLAFRRGWFGVVLLIGVLIPMPAYAWTWEDLWSRPDQQATRKLQQGKPKEAAELFQDPNWQGVAHYRSGQYEEAAQAFGDQSNPESLYNQGNALARLGKYEDALKSYEQTLHQNPSHEDAKHNADLVKKLLEQQQQQSQNGQGDQQSSQGSENQGSGSNNQQNAQGQQNKENRPGDSDQENSVPSSNKNQSDKKESESSPGHQNSEEDAANVAEEQSNSPAKDVQPDQNEEADKSQVAKAEPEQEEDLEERQATEQWLRRIPDDPGGLLRRKFLLEHRRRGNTQQAEGPSW